MKKKCLIIETHSDDSCYSAAGFIKKYSSEYDFYAMMLVCSSTYLYHKQQVVSKDDRVFEYTDYCDKLGMKCINNVIAPIDADTRLDTVPIVSVVKKIEEAINYVKPDLLLIQGNSVHQDHIVTYKACLSALRPCCGFYPKEIWIMENPTHVHLDPTLDALPPNIYVELTEDEINEKIELFKECFPSQIRDDDNYLGLRNIKDWARYRGIEARCMYAEAFYQFGKVM